MNEKFALDMREHFNKTTQYVEEVAMLTVLAVGKSLVMKSPVGNPSMWNGGAGRTPPPGYTGGTVRANWQHGMNVTPSGIKSTPDAGGTQTIAELEARIRAAGGRGIHYLANNLPYANRLEYGHSRQAPQGMVRLTIQEFEQYFADAKAKAKK